MCSGKSPTASRWRQVDISSKKVEINVKEVFEYKSGTIRDLKNDYNRMYKGKFKITK